MKSGEFGLAAALLLVMSLTSGPAASETWGSIELLGRIIEPGTRSKFALNPDSTFQGSFLNMPIFVVRGSQPGIQILECSPA